MATREHKDAEEQERISEILAELSTIADDLAPMLGEVTMIAEIKSFPACLGFETKPDEVIQWLRNFINAADSKL